MALNNLEDRLECAIAHINTSVDIDPWARKLAVESMRMRIALMKGGQPDIVRCKDCKFYTSMNRETKTGICGLLLHQNFGDDWYCAGAERRTDEH